MTEREASTDRDLALRAKSGEKGAFDQLVRRHKEALFRLIRPYIGNNDDAYDVLQDTFVSAWLALSRYDENRPLLSWLRTIALNKCRDRGRRIAVRQRLLQLFALEQTGEVEPPADLRSDKENLEAKRLKRLEETIAALPQSYKEPLLLTTVAGLSQQDAARELKTSVKAIEMRLRRAKQRLAQALADLAETP